jgi:hypothetical protein
MNIVRQCISRRTFASGLVSAPVAFALSGRSMPARAADDVTIDLNIYQISEDWHAVLKNVLEGFTQANPNIGVNLNIQPGEQYWDKLQTQYAAGNAPDVTLLNMDWLVPGAARGMFVDLKPLMDRDSIDGDGKVASMVDCYTQEDRRFTSTKISSRPQISTFLDLIGHGRTSSHTRIHSQIHRSNNGACICPISIHRPARAPLSSMEWVERCLTTPERVARLQNQPRKVDYSTSQT